MKCDTCGQEHPDDEIELSYKLPDPIFDLSPSERNARAKADGDFAVLDKSRFFVRTVLPMPVHGRADDYAIGVWVEVERSVLERVLKRWSDADQAAEPPMAARLANAIKSLPDTLNLPVELRLTGPTTRASVHVLSTDHPLHGEQADGISVHRLQDYRAG